ncbi:capsid protein [Streptococcus suis]|nr:capsid protein [Streptococcus agalactiae]MCC9696119.1 capsid protein [Streptococcus agalactiae]MDW8691165.1 capsid protein [Streptococcus suis]HEL2737509.1 capsid protein [Streptococcus suis]
MSTKIYTKNYMAMLAKITESRSRFLRSFGGQIQIYDGVADSDTMLHLKVNNTKAVIKKYDKGENVGFGTGTGSTNRFGQRLEIKSIDLTVPYEAPIAIHEGIDNVTVNDVPDKVVAERLEENALAQTEYINELLAKALSDNASETLTGQMTEEGVTKTFAAARKKFVNNKISKSIAWVAYVTSDVYDFLIDSKLATTAKNSSANIDEQSLYKFKGFVLEETPDEYFQEGEQVMFAVDGVGIAGVGLQIVRTIDADDFYGVAIQGAGKYGKYIADENKVGILKAKLAPAG